MKKMKKNEVYKYVDEKLKENVISFIPNFYKNNYLKANNLKSIKEMIEFLEKNPVIKGRLLKIINSGYYYIPHKINTIKQAFAILGQEKIKEILINYKYHDFIEEFSNVSRDLKIEIYLFIYISAHITRLLAKIKGNNNTLYFFSQMMFRHLGIFFLPDINDSFLKKIKKLILNHNFEDIYSYEESLYGLNHIDITRYILDYWSFDDGFIQSTVKPFKKDYFSRLIFYAERIAIFLFSDNAGKSEDFKEFINEFEREILISGEILIDVLSKLKGKIDSIQQELGLEDNYSKRVRNLINILERKDDQNMKDIILALNKRENKLYMVDSFIEGINNSKMDTPTLNPLKYFLKTFNKYFDLDRMFYFEQKEENKYVLKEFIADKKFNKFLNKEIKINFKKYNKKIFRKNDNINLKKFEKELGYSNYLIIPLTIQNDTRAFLLIDNNITKKEFSEEMVENIKEFVQYSQVIFFDLYYNKFRNVQSMLDEIHKLGVSFNHMINNSLTVILTSTNILSHKLKDEKNIQMLEKIKSATDRISEYLEKFREIDNLKDLSYLQGINMYDLEKGESDESMR
ncbi:MAG: HDOD domain-containing protein [Candidatus Mcinerneyibacterium aminivorans]|uniref:HDOD domain-containing protein n=1 Tax=Candidatus Mcinerneyibacterium aminivorans TaxID=2703815 RepID=A0A5D0ME00_9BACT|nr:MAG: HDOD domain-containing protein [Candidatus Mcinerneyibacterium aminivorans]